MSSETKVVSSGISIGFWGILFIVLLVLKLTKLAEISWLVVFLPFIIPTCVVGFFAILFLIASIMASD
jgi:hypothetical protein